MDGRDQNPAWRIEMLVLTRKPGEKVFIGDGITVTVASIIGNKVRLAFTAPDDIRICGRSWPAGWIGRREVLGQKTMRCHATRLSLL
jgi:Global regulator protein family